MTSEPKRPFYLVLALFGALALGMLGSSSGWLWWTRYQEPADISLIGQEISDTADRAAVESRAQAYVQTLDDAKARGWPVAVATLLLGSAVVVFAMRTLGGHAGSRTFLVQVIVAQAGFAIFSTWLLRDVGAAFVRLDEAATIAAVHEHLPRGAATDEVLRIKLMAVRASDAVQLAFQAMASAFVVVALTRRRVRDFFAAAAAALEER